MRTLLTILCLLIISAGAKAQGYIGLEAGTGYGTYTMTSGSELMTAIENELPFRVTRTDDFPGHVNFFGALTYTTHYQSYGLRFRYMSTGARASAADYSAEYILDAIAKGYQVGFFSFIPISGQDAYSFDIHVEGGLIWSNVRYQDILTIENEYVESWAEFAERSAFIEVGPRFAYYLTSRVSVNASAHYCLDFSDTFSNEVFLFSDWTGLRADLSVSLKLIPVK